MAIELNFLGMKALDFASLDPGKFASIAVIIFLIIYLIKPKPTERIIPSLMFLISRRKKGKFNSFFRKLIRDPLMFIQLLLLLFICFSALEPFFTYEHDISTDSTVLVLDASASTSEDFERVKREAASNIKGLTSIIMSRNVPQVIVQDEKPDEVEKIITTLQPAYTPTNLLDSMRKADEIMANKSGKIIIISDFRDTENGFEEVISYRDFLEGKGRMIELIPIDTTGDNVGFISAEYINNKVSLAIKNFGSEDVTRTISSREQKMDIDIKVGSVEIVKFEVEKGKTILSIEEKDSFDLDNKYYLNVPRDKNMKVLLLTNDLVLEESMEKSYLETFLEASPYVDYEKVEPPNIVDMKFDVVIVKDVEPDLMISKIRDDLTEYLEKGGSAVVFGQKDLGAIGLDDILPVIPEGNIIEEGEVEPLEHEMMTDLSFAKLKKYVTVRNNDEAIAIADATAGEDRTALISYMKYGMGKVMYYGIPEKDNEFALSASYPIIWNRALRFVSDFNNFDSMNTKTSEDGYAEIIGFNDEGNKEVAVNLLDEKESDTTSIDIERIEKETESGDSSFITMQEDLTPYILPLVLLMLLWEIYYIKRRGDI